MHLNNVNCTMVMLGISHDSGYAPFLDELRSDIQTRSRLRILEGFPTVRELVATDIEIVNLNESVFRSTKLLTDRVQMGFVGTTRAAPSSPPTSKATVINAASNGGSWPAPGETSGGSSSSTTTDAGSKHGDSNGNAASSLKPSLSSTNVNVFPQLSFPASTTKSMQKKAVAAATVAAALLEKKQQEWSPGPRGLDPPAQYSVIGAASIKERKGGDKFCNQTVINGYCNTDNCPYNHRLKATAEDRKALIFFMRQAPCVQGQDCITKDCTYGHNVCQPPCLSYPALACSTC